MEKQQIVMGSRDGGTVSGAAPAFFVILKQQQGNGKADQGILVANRDACALASSVSTPVNPKVKTCLPADCVSGGITVTLDNNSMWNEFYHRNTEMILTKQGRRMFPYCRYWITGLDAFQRYILVMDISPVDNHRYKWNGRWWEPSGKAEPHVLGRVFIHPESPCTGQYWMHKPVSFYKLKLTNNTLDQEGHIILHSMHRYLPRLHLVPADKATEVIQLNGPDVHTFTFPQTEFFAVTAYQNIQITQLKIDYNPFAKGFRDDGLNSRPQRDGKQNSKLELEGGEVFSTAGTRGCRAGVDAVDLHQKNSDSSFVGQNPSDPDVEKETLNAERDFLRFLDTELPSGDMPKIKQEVSESPNPSSYESSSRVASPLDPNGHFNIVIKEEPVDDYDYESSVCTQGVTVKKEDTDEETDEYSNTDDDDPILQKQLMIRSKTEGTDGEFKSRKRLLTSPSGVAKAKMLKLDSGKMPVVYLEPCAVTKSTVKISELPQTMLSCKKEKSPLCAIQDSLPVCFENHKDSCLATATLTEELATKKQPPGSKMSQKYPSIRETQWHLPKSRSFNLKGSVSCHFSAKDICGRKRPGVLKNPLSLKGSGNDPNTLSSIIPKRGRPRKLKISKAGRPPKGVGKALITSKSTSLGPSSIVPDVKPDLEDVDGVLFVSFASKEALDIHTVDRAGEESQDLQAPLLTTNDPDCQARIQALEKELMEELKTLRHKQVIHPSLQEVGLKLNSVDPTMSIDLKYLGVQLPLSYSNYSLWNYPGTNPNSPDTGFPFVSRTGKTNDFTKIKGWRGKLHGASRNEGGSSEGSLKNRSAFCSDKLDEYLENEGKLMETSMEFSSSTPTSPVVYQLPTKSTSYVRTLDSVLKKQSTIIPSTSSMFKPVPLSSTSRKTRTPNKQTASNSRAKSSYKPILPSPIAAKQKHNFSASGEKAAKSASNSSSAHQADSFVVPALDESILPKQISLRQAPQQQQAARAPGLSKSHVKLMDLEDCALWDGKPRTYITEERADISLATLLTAQASLKTKPIHKIIRRRAPPCNNDFCRLGCVCASLLLEKRQPTHCRRPDCMFGCTCLKRKVLLVKGGSKHKKIMKKAVRGNLLFCGAQEEQQEDEDLEEEGDGEEDELKVKEKKKRKRVEYTICDSEPEQPIRSCPLWVKVEGEVDPEPIYIPTPSVIEPVKSSALANPEAVLSSKHRSSSGVKPSRVYTPKPNPVVREEDKDPVYLYFESMMTCARVREYDCKREKKKQKKEKSEAQSSNIKEHEPELQCPEKATCETDKETEKSGEKSWCSSRSEGDSSSSSFVHHTTPAEPTKLIEIIPDQSWEEDNNKILTILSQHINSKVPQCLKVGSFVLELASEHKAQDENQPPVYSSRVKISMPSYQDKDEKPEIADLETPDSGVPSGPSHTTPENLKFLRADRLDKLREKLHGGKGLPFYAGISPAGKLVVYKRKANISPSGFIQVNDKRYPQAKLLLGQMGALHPANRLAAYITGRLRPTVLPISALSTVISKVASQGKAAASETTSVQVPTSSSPKTTSSTSTTSTPTVRRLKTHVPAQRQIAARPSPGGMFAQFVMNKAGALQQKIPGASTRQQPLSGPQKLSIKPSPIMVVAPMVPSRPSPAQCTLSPAVTAATTTSPPAVESTAATASAVTSPSQTKANEPDCSPPAVTVAAAPATPGINTSTTPSSTTPAATVNISKSTGIVAPVATTSFPNTVVISPTVTCPVVTTPTSTVVLATTAMATSVVTTPTSSAVSVPVILSGVNTPSLNARKDAPPQALNSSPQKVSPGADKRVGPRLLLIPVQQTSPALRPLNSAPLVPRQRMVLQPVRSPGAMNLFRHPSGQIIQLVPLQQLRPAGAQPSVQPVMFRNPGSVVGIRLPAPSKPPESPMSPTSVSSTSPTKSAGQTAGSKLSPTSNLATQASSLPSVTSFVSQPGTLTLRLSPPAASSMTNQAASESKVTSSSVGLPGTAANLIPLQSGSFALLQLPGQKTVPNSILHHFASLQMKKDYRKICKKEDTSTAQQKSGKAPNSDKAEVRVSEATVSDTKQEENELPINQSNNVEESPSGTVVPAGNSPTLQMVEKDLKVLEKSCDDSSSSQTDVAADVVSSDHSYISEKPNEEEEKGALEEKEDSVSSEAVVESVPANSETVCESSEQPSLAPLDNAHPQSLENQETAQVKTPGKEQIHKEQEGSPVKEEEGDAQTQIKQEGDAQTKIKQENEASSEQPQGQQEQDAQLENKKEQRETELSQDKQECQGSAMLQPQLERKEYKNSTEAENKREKKEIKSEISPAKQQDCGTGEQPAVNTEESKANLGRQESCNNKEQDAFGCQEEMKTGQDIVTHVNSSWSKISSIVPALEIKSEVDNKADTSERSDFLPPEQRPQESRHHSKGCVPTVDTTTDDMEEEEEEEEEEDDEEDEEDEKTDDSADELLDGASDFLSEEEIDVEKVDVCEYSEDDEQVDVETVEELSEKINIARLKATAAHFRPSKQKYHARNSSDEKFSEKSAKHKRRFRGRKLKSEAEAFAHYRQTHTANERRRRSQMKGLFEKLKRALGLHNLPKVSKSYILKQAYEEIQGLTDHADKLIGQKTLLTRKQDVLIRKVSTLSGKTEEVVLKKLEYIYAKQKAVEEQKKKKQTEPEEIPVTSTVSTKQEGSSAPSREPIQVAMTNRRGKPLILARKSVRTTEDTSSPLSLTAANLVMTPQGQVLTLKSPLVPGQVAAVPSTLLQTELKPQPVSPALTAQPGLASVMIQLPGSTVPVQVKGILANSTIPITLSIVSGNPAPSAVVSTTEPRSESEDSFMMPKIVNVTSLAAEGSTSLNLNKNKNSNTTAAGTQASEKSLAVAPLESRKSDSVLKKKKDKVCPGDSCGDGRNTRGPTKIVIENKDGIPQLLSVSCTKESPEPFSKKLCLGEFVGSQARRKDGDPGGERLKSKELPFHKLQIKDSRLEMELRKVASAMEEAELDASELLSSMEEGDDTDETLTSLLNEIAFLNQQLNDDAAAMSELPSTLNSNFSHEDAEARRGTASDLSTADGSSFQFGSFKELSEVPEGGGSISPLLLHLEDDDLTDGDKNSGEASSEVDVLKIVIGTEMKDPLPSMSVISGGNGKTVTTLAESTTVTPPVLQMKTNPEASNADTLWRPMPKLAPLGLKVASLPVDSEGQSNKVMPLLAPIVAKLAPSGGKTSLPGAVQEGQDNKVMPTLAPLVTKMNTTGTLPSNSAGK
ncbi:MAX gene-associated protein isoform X2 [Heliangelus exortis]|uniref:MAX gene-associated protein isoform X2 n=1 Tax=Heliangelus exortis TaxID=472823 RepID=UPI003A921935